MALLTVHQDGTHLLRGGKFFPLISDTAWSAFSDMSLAEWKYYVGKRRAQGFTSIAVSILPILHDRTIRADSREPFFLTTDGHYDFNSPNLAYFDNARDFVKIAAEEGLVTSLVLLWCNYVPGTWGAERTPWAVMEKNQRGSYVSLVTKTFSDLDPIMVISGDDHFVNPVSVAVYGQVLTQVAVEAPHCLTTMHSTPTTDLPPEIADSPDLDFYIYQSGHDMEQQNLCFDLARLYLEKPFRKPIVNMEPAYEQHGYGGGKGRFGAADIRRAIWWSILGGAAAGIGYGAHGVWQWHQTSGEFTNPGFSMEPFSWQTALNFEGAYDVSLAAELMIDQELFRLTPKQEILVNSDGGFRAASNKDETFVALYLPFPREIILDVTGPFKIVKAVNLKNRTPVIPIATHSDGLIRISQIDQVGEVVIFLRKAN